MTFDRSSDAALPSLARERGLSPPQGPAAAEIRSQIRTPPAHIEAAFVRPPRDAAAATKIRDEMAAFVAAAAAAAARTL